MKKTLFLMLSFIVCLSMFSCSSNDKNGDDFIETQKDIDILSNDTNVADASNKKNKFYEDALKFLELGDYEDAYKSFNKCIGYKDADEYLKRFVYLPHVRKSSLSSDNIAQIEYDECGKIIKETVYTNDNHLYEVTSYDYNNNILVKSVTSLYYEQSYDGTLIFKTEPVLKYYTIYDNTGSILYQEYTDSLNQPIYGPSYKPEVKYYDYDVNGNIIKAVRDDYTVEYQFNSEGQIVKETYSKGCDFEYEREYNSEGLLIKYISNSNGYLEYSEYIYNSFDAIEQYNYYSNGERKTAVYYYYDSENRLINIKSNNIGDLSFEYDKFGNLCSLTQHLEGMMGSSDTFNTIQFSDYQLYYISDNPVVYSLMDNYSLYPYEEYFWHAVY